MNDRDPILYPDREPSRAPWLFFAFLVGIALIIFASTCKGQPFTISDAELAKLSWADVLATAKHQGELFKQEHSLRLKLEANIVAAQTAQTEALNATTAAAGALVKLQGEIDLLAKHDREMTDKVAEQKELLVKKDLAILWRNVIIGSLVLAIGVYAFLKFYMRLPI